MEICSLRPDAFAFRHFQGKPATAGWMEASHFPWKVTDKPGPSTLLGDLSMSWRRSPQRPGFPIRGNYSQESREKWSAVRGPQ